jgi:hypothetical protein
MPNIKPASELNNYDNVMDGVYLNSPVLFTLKGRGSCTILDIHEYEKDLAKLIIEDVVKEFPI